jgi:hypothetical protein
MRHLAVMIAAVLLVPVGAKAQTMNAAQFHDRAVALQKKGPLALLSKDLKRLMKEAEATGLRVRANRLAALKAGDKPRYCPPEGSSRMGSSEFLTRLGAIPAVDRARIDLAEAMNRILARKFPCPG